MYVSTSIVNSILHKYAGALALTNQFDGNFVVPADMICVDTTTRAYAHPNFCLDKLLYILFQFKHRKYK